MKLSADDLRKLRLPLAGTLAALTLGGTLILGAEQKVQHLRREHNALLSARHQREQDFAQARQKAEAIKEQAVIFQHWRDNGLIGAEKRMAWSALLKATQTALRLPGMRFEFEARTPLAPTSKQNHAHFVSLMHLQLRLLHEEDLLNTLARLEQEKTALVRIRHCSLTPANTRLDATCEIEWITIDRMSEPQ